MYALVHHYCNFVTFLLMIGWLLNTSKNVGILEKHVGQQIAKFVHDYECRYGSMKRELCETNVNILSNPEDLSTFSKVRHAFLDSLMNDLNKS